MKEKLDLVKFNLTEEMTKELISFNSLKKDLIKLRNKKNVDLKKIQELEDELNMTRIKFIKEFRNNNQEEINTYLQLKDQI